MVKMITSNVIIGGIIVLINLIPLILKKYEYIKITAVISLILYFLYVSLG